MKYVYLTRPGRTASAKVKWAQLSAIRALLQHAATLEGAAKHPAAIEAAGLGAGVLEAHEEQLPSEVLESNSALEGAAATRIQAAVRGHLTRKQRPLDSG